MSLLITLERTLLRWNRSFQALNLNILSRNIMSHSSSLINSIMHIHTSLSFPLHVNSSDLWSFGFGKLILPQMTWSRLCFNDLNLELFLQFSNRHSINMLLDRLTIEVLLNLFLIVVHSIELWLFRSGSS